MFKNKIVLLLFVIYITIAFAVPTNIVEYNNREVSEGDVNHEHKQSVNENYFPGGFMNAKILCVYIKKHLPNVAKGITPEICDWFVQNFAKSQPDKGLAEDEYVNVISTILNWIYETVK
ncbi:uncharacterized protein LOC126909164 [Daktulosphaira vitifoliae]|uniref:uncharacterized protein LOC126909164 n=1 Tax=Daktulosphaira vitifoliae TaxID=58002 RepID=UPI0021A9E166|nr:uncharacterized protein LOC126909164 [Daktulosphaira vitifoliae]